MPKYVGIKIKKEILDVIKQCQRPGEPLSDTLLFLLDPLKITGRVNEAAKRGKNGGENAKGVPRKQDH